MTHELIGGENKPQTFLDKVVDSTIKRFDSEVIVTIDGVDYLNTIEAAAYDILKEVDLSPVEMFRLLATQTTQHSTESHPFNLRKIKSTHELTIAIGVGIVSGEIRHRHPEILLKEKLRDALRSDS